MSKCVCGSETEHAFGDAVRVFVCSPCFREWLDSPAYERGIPGIIQAGGGEIEPAAEDNYQRQLHDWLETRRRERINGFKETKEGEAQ